MHLLRGRDAEQAEARREDVLRGARERGAERLGGVADDQAVAVERGEGLGEVEQVRAQAMRRAATRGSCTFPGISL